jgi:hypothetical protein
MDQKELERVMLAAVGDPVSGAVRDYVPAMAAAVAQALNPKPAKEDRVIKPAETR